MINPTPDDIGRTVYYVPHFPGAKPERGVISSFNQSYVFVRYGTSPTPQATSPRDLFWSLDNA